jgi:hypothetical protein
MRFLLHAIAGLVLTAITGGFALALPAPAPRAAATSVEIAPGERIELKFAPDGALTVLSRGPSPASDTAGMPKVDNSYEQLMQMRIPGHPQADQLTIIFAQTPADGARLIVVNGYGDPVIYQAALMLDRNGVRSLQPTSICPVRAGAGGVESWGQPVVAISLSGFRKADDTHMACNNGSLLSKSAAPASADRFVCVGGKDKGVFSPLTVTLMVDANGAIGFQSATWTLSKPDLMHSPLIGLEYGMEGDHVVDAPAALRVTAAISLTPMPTAATADIVLLVNGVEKTRRPWRMYAQNIATLRSAPEDKRPVGFVGVIPFSPVPAGADDGLHSLLASVGDASGGTIEVRIVGDDGVVLAAATYTMADPPVRDRSLVLAALRQALALAKTPTQCQKLPE